MDAPSCSSADHNPRTNEVTNQNSKKRSHDNDSTNENAKKRSRVDNSSNQNCAKDNSDKLKTKPTCKYGEKCYRKNENHWKEFSHPKQEQDQPDNKGQELEKEKFEKSRLPFYMTTVHGIDDCFNVPNIALSISDILNLDAEKLLESCQFNYMIDIPWLVNKYPSKSRAKPLLIVHGSEGKEKMNLQSDAMSLKNIDLLQAKLPIPYGTHHTKMMLLLYDHGLRVVVHTANLIEQDWNQKSQGIWISPLFKKSQDGNTTNTKQDHFKDDLLEYMNAYGSAKLSKWIQKLQSFDMSNAKARIIGSVPGRHGGQSLLKWGHMRLRKLLSNHGPSASHVTADWSVIGQFSSIGSLGTEPNKWLTSEWLQSFSQCRKNSTGNALQRNTKAKLNLVFPTMENVRHSLEGYSAGGSLPFSVENAMKQRWMRPFLCQWRSTRIGRSLASPHIKSYTRLSPRCDEAAWFCVTSANLSKAAWGSLEKNGTQLMIRSYEIGVLVTPEIMGSNEDFLQLSSGCEGRDLRLPFDVPLTNYTAEDKPWVWNIRYTKEDSHGKLWNPNF
ncbi:tyrosyl-DNA phosphodiesterase 1-like [Clytia hemisphaerica]|uniref:PBZ-type domain-containing protein n=1 Tax=Clytia hemisphaerica TaxID=252671 RepID=A0A7M5WRV3_9CNID|eukprot:TCONS_00026158-protein